MGFLGGIGKAIGGFVKQVAPQILQAVAPAASKLLGGIAGDIFQKGASFISKGLSALPLPSPLKALAEKLLGKGAAKLTDLAQGGIDKLLQKLTDAITTRFAPGVGNVAVPGIATPARQDAIAANTPASSSSAAAATASTGSSSAAATTSSSAPSASVSGPSTPPDPKNYGDLQDQNNMQRLLKDQQAYQTNFSAMQNYWSMISNIMKANFQTLQGMAQNLR